MRCAIWYNLDYLKNVKNAHGGLLILTPPWIFFTFFKLHRWYQIARYTTLMFLSIYQSVHLFIYSFIYLFIVASQFQCIVLFLIVFTSCPVGVYQLFLYGFIRVPVLPVFQSFLPVFARLPVVSICFYSFTSRFYLFLLVYKSFLPAYQSLLLVYKPFTGRLYPFTSRFYSLLPVFQSFTSQYVYELCLDFKQ